MKKNDFTEILKKIPRSLVSRKKTYSTRAWAFFKQKRKALKKLGRPAFFIWVVGCQRSGTTLLERIFRQDLDSEVFGEFSELAIGRDRTSLKPFKEVEEIFTELNARYLVVRPLFESDRVKEILDFFHPSLAVWMFREPRYVVSSMVNKWGDRFFDISRCVEADIDDRWRLEGLYQGIKQEARRMTGTDEKIEDLYALYWFKRNEIALQPAFRRNNRIRFLNYKSLVCEPEKCIDTIIKQAGGQGLWKYFSTDANQSSIKREVAPVISAEVMMLCDNLYNELSDLGKQDFPLDS